MLAGLVRATVQSPRETEINEHGAAVSPNHNVAWESVLASAARVEPQRTRVHIAVNPGLRVNEVESARDVFQQSLKHSGLVAEIIAKTSWRIMQRNSLQETNVKTASIIDRSTSMNSAQRAEASL